MSGSTQRIEEILAAAISINDPAQRAIFVAQSAGADSSLRQAVLTLLRAHEAANLLALDLQRHLDHEPVLARPPTTLYRSRKFVRKHRRAVAVAAVFLALLAVATVLNSALAFRSNRAHRQAVAARQAELEQRRRLEATGDLLRRRMYAADMNLAQAAIAANNPGRARQLLERHRPQADDMELRHWEWRYLRSQCASDAWVALPPHDKGIRSLAISPDDRWLAWGADEGRVQLWDLQARRVAATLEPGAGDPAVVASSPRGNFLAASVRRGLVNTWAVASWQPAASLPHDGWIRTLRLSPDGQWLACMGDHLSIDLWEVARTRLIARSPIGALRDYYKCKMAFSPGAPCLAVGETDGRIRILTLPALQERLQFPAVTGGITALAFSPDGHTLASGSGYDEFAIRLWNPITGAAKGVLAGHAGWVNDLAFSPDGGLLASASTDQTIRLWNTSSWQEEAVLRGHQHEVWTIAFSQMAEPWPAAAGP
ncbi:MAG TPA: WD40 repeat domain-containing protein, partial [Methylomirabilota bacterium]|nr:WD40 repeat domain-containing protein [Methylomirabilota bacterium]